MNIATKINPIVDADAHVNPSHDMWADYLPADFRALGAAARTWRRLRLYCF